MAWSLTGIVPYFIWRNLRQITGNMLLFLNSHATKLPKGIELENRRKSSRFFKTFANSIVNFSWMNCSENYYQKKKLTSWVGFLMAKKWFKSFQKESFPKSSQLDILVNFRNSSKTKSQSSSQAQTGSVRASCIVWSFSFTCPGLPLPGSWFPARKA